MLPFVLLLPVISSKEMGKMIENELGGNLVDKVSPHGKCPYSEFFWPVTSLNAEKYGPEKLRIRTLFTWCFSTTLSY